MKIKNISTEIQAVTGIPAFTPLEIREVTKKDFEILINNHNFIADEDQIKKTKKPNS